MLRGTAMARLGLGHEVSMLSTQPFICTADRAGVQGKTDLLAGAREAGRLATAFCMALLEGRYQT